MKRKMLIAVLVVIISSSPSVIFASSKYPIEENQKEDEYYQDIIDHKPVCTLDKNGKIVSKKYVDTTRKSVFGEVKATGTYPNSGNCYGTILYTKDTSHRIARVVGHAAIVYSNEKVVESVSNGVKLGKNNWNKKKHCRAGVVIPLSDEAHKKVRNKCYEWIGKPYNWDFSNTKTRSKFYCSQLVYAGYKDVVNVNLNDNGGIVFPSELIKDSMVSVIYKKG